MSGSATVAIYVRVPAAAYVSTQLFTVFSLQSFNLNRYNTMKDR